MYHNEYQYYQDSSGAYPKRSRGDRTRQHQQPTGYQYGGFQPPNNYPMQQQQMYARDQEYATQPQPMARYSEQIYESNNYQLDDVNNSGLASNGGGTSMRDSETNGPPAAGGLQPRPSRKIQLFIGGIPPSVTESNRTLTSEMFKGFFESYGPMSECRMVIDKVSRKLSHLSDRPAQRIRVRHFRQPFRHTKTSQQENLHAWEGGSTWITLQIECKDAISKNDSNVRVSDEKTRKIFVGGLPTDVNEGSCSPSFRTNERILL
jgi:hypothetical protein